MKTSAVAFLAFACVIGVSMAQFGFGGLSAGNTGTSSFLPLIFLFLFLFLFNNNGSSLFSSGSDSGDTTIIFGNFSGPTGGK
ncbi:hypothetical protein ACF0H5_022206 [Mactra antiquata]